MLLCASVNEPNLAESDVFICDTRTYVFYNQIMDGQNLMKFGMVIVPLAADKDS
jgi:hypothetical protein